MTWEEQSQPLQEIMEDFAGALKDVFFLQIGCCDGISEDIMQDLVKRYAWSGILVEPVNYLYERLRFNYRGQSNLLFCNAAISDKDGYRDFYYLRANNDGLPYWHDQIGSFFEEVIWKHADEIPNFSEYITRERVKCFSVKSLIKMFDVRKVDILHIDAEGYDFSIIRQFNFEAFKPIVIKYEHKHLIESDQKDSWNYLRDKGYFVFHNYMDSMAILEPLINCNLLSRIKNTPFLFI